MDLINRQDAIKAIEDLPNCYNGFSDTYDKACIIGTLEEVPSAEPEIMERRMKYLVKRTERGWAGHYICADRCLFRRNTLLEYQDKKWIVSTVGNFALSTRGTDMIGADRWYETMVFEAEMKNGYIDADVTKQIYPENDWGIWGESWEQVKTLHPYPDNDANDMHERIVNEMAGRIVEGR